MIAVADKSMRSMLKDQRLQEQILAIDNATDREKVCRDFTLVPTCRSRQPHAHILDSKGNVHLSSSHPSLL